MSMNIESDQDGASIERADFAPLEDISPNGRRLGEVGHLALPRKDDFQRKPIVAHVIEETVTDHTADISITNSSGEQTVYHWEFPQQNEFLHIFREIFDGEEYKWIPQTAFPRIIDLGSHIGLSDLYWKAVSPGARIIAVEASPTNYANLSANVQRNGLTNVQTIEAAVTGEEGEIVLHVHKPSTELRWRPNFTGREPYDPTQYIDLNVPAVTLSSLIGNERVDLLKIDIEGIEGVVLREVAASGKLGNVNEIIMEFHNYPGNPANNLPEVLQILADAGFVIRKAYKGDMPVDLRSIQPEDTISFVIHATR